MSLITPSVIKKAVSGKRVLVDTNIIIYLTDSIPSYDGLSRLLFEMIEKGDVSAVISVISIAEVMQGTLRKGLIRSTMDVKNYLLNFPNAYCQEITAEVLGHIGLDSAIQWSKLRTPDSLIIASGLANDVDLFISNDQHFKKAISKKSILTFDM
ncbi:type II toxin-antitoxin system VapC family toxin [Thermodesulfobacteriota bacterium]